MSANRTDRTIASLRSKASVLTTIIAVLLTSSASLAQGGPAGACCLGNGACTVVTSANCDAMGGTFMGPNTDCTNDPCNGACCLIGQGGCMDDESIEMCQILGGNFQGFGTDCADVTCDPTLCDCQVGDPIEPEVCDDSFDCMNANPGCDLPMPAESDFTTAADFNTGSLCGMAICGTTWSIAGGQAPPCGSEDTDWYLIELTVPGMIMVTVRSEFNSRIELFPYDPNTMMCDLGGSLFTAMQVGNVMCSNTAGPQMGIGVTAELPPGKYALVISSTGGEHPCGDLSMMNDYRLTIDCFLVAACCFPDGSCQDLAEPECIAAGGAPQAPGTVCTSFDCPVVGACCFDDGTCQVLTPDDCEAAGGVHQGDMTVCDPNTCPLPLIACCFPDQSCMDLLLDACLMSGGLPQHAGSMCATTICPFERAHPGWNWVDNAITLTANEPTYWSALTGMPKGVSPFTVLDPGDPPGRPAMDGTNDRVLRGYVIAWAVDQFGQEIRWNHLKGEGTLIDYRDDLAWEYNTFNHAVVSGVAHGEVTGEPGVLRLDGLEYSVSFDQLLLNFQAAGSDGFSGPIGSGFAVESDTDLTLFPPAADLRQNNDGPVTTKASFDVWNMNEVKFSGAHRCVTCWDQTLLSRYDTPNHFLYPFLQTDHGKARIDGHAADVCDVLDDPETPEDESVTSILSPLLGVYARHLEINGTRAAASGSNLVGLGVDDTAVVQYDVAGDGGPPEAQWPEDADGMVDWLIRKTKPKTAPTPDSLRLDLDQAVEASGPGQDRVSATEKGSLVYFTKVEIRWDAFGALVQDTFLSLTNDFPKDVRVQMYFINGDAPLPAAP